MAVAPFPSTTTIECGYCSKQNEDLTKPKVLPCRHIHCSSCLDKALDEQNIVECPDCKCKCELDGQISDLPDANLEYCVHNERSAVTGGLCEKCSRLFSWLYLKVIPPYSRMETETNIVSVVDGESPFPQDPAAVEVKAGAEETSPQSETEKQETDEQTEIEEEFDKIYYEFLKIICVKDYTLKILERFRGEIIESVQPDNEMFLLVKVKSSTPGEARKMMDALLDLFCDVSRSVLSHTIKLEYDGDKEKLSKALIDDLQDPSLGFIARLVTDEDIRIIGSLANMDRDIHTLESYIYDYKKRNPAQTVTEKRQADIKLSNGTLVSIVEGDLTKMKTDAVVTFSSAELSHQHGISRAIALASGQRFQAQGKKFVDQHGMLKEGEIWVQPADGRLMYNGVRHVIHAIAPVPVKGRDVSPLLVKTISSALSEVEKLKCGTVAFPAICAEDRSVPISTCADCYSTAMKEFFSTNPATCLQQIYFVVDDASFVDNLYRAIANMSLDRRTDVPDPDQQLKDIKSIDSAVYSGTASRVTNNPPIVTSDQCPSRTSPVDKSYVDNGHNSITGETSRARSFSDPCCALPLIDQEPLHRHFSTNAIHNTDTTAGDKSSVGGVTRCARLTTTTVVATSVVTEVKRKKYDCPICLDDLKDPESLPCSHKFCKDCIKQLIETSETRQCPTCRQPFGNERSLMEDD